MSAALARAVAFYLLWLVLMQSAKPGDLIIGLLAALAATRVSLHLLAPASGCLRFGSMIALFPHFLWVSIAAGIDIARRVFDPRMPLQSGFIRCPLGFPPGLARNTFSTFTSLMPGSVPVDESNEDLIYHCLDTSQPVVEQLWAEERLLAKALIAGRRHD